MTTTAADYELGQSAKQTGGGPQEFVCGGEDLKDILHALTQQVANADQRNSHALEYLRERLELLGRDAGHARRNASAEQGLAFARIEDGAQQLAERIAAVSSKRELNRPDGHLAVASGPVAAVEDLLKPLAVSFANQGTTVSASAAGDVDEPWDAAAAEALARLYESGEADLGVKVRWAETSTIASSEAMGFEAEFADLPRPVATEPANNGRLNDMPPQADRAWLDGRFAEIAARIEQSLAASGAGHAFLAFDRRLTQLEARFGSALASVATRTDVAGLRIIEAHINELTAQFEQANAQLSRLDSVEIHLADLLHLFANHTGLSANGSSEAEIEAVATAVADRVASRLPQHLEAMPAGGAGAAAGELQRLIEGFVAGQRDNEEHTSNMLDTMQQAMIRMLDRMDAIEDAVPAYPASQGSFAHASQMPAAQQIRPAPEFSEQMAHAAQTNAAFAPMPVVYAADAREDSRAAAIADARRAARKVAAQTETDALSPAMDSGRLRRGVPPVKLSGPELASGARKSIDKTVAASAAAGGSATARSRVPLMVAGVALVAAVGLLAASVGLNRGLPFMVGGSSVRQSPLTIDNGDASELSAAGSETPTPPMTPNGAVQRPSRAIAPLSPGAAAARPRPESVIENLNDRRDAETEAAMAQQEASVRSRGPAATSLPMGMTMTQARVVPNDSDLARMRQQRNLTSLASQLAAVQANAPAVPASLIPNGGASNEPDLAISIDGAKASEMPPALIGPISLRTAASKGDPSAEFEVAARFAEGRGIAQDFKQAMVWYQRSAQRGFAPAQYRLGTLYERGIGIKADGERAKIWYRRAAEQGHVKAMHNLAVLNSGREQSADYATAVTWFTAASERGLADSQYNLGVLHESGLGLPRDFKQAYYWLSLASRNGDKDAARRRDQVRMKLEEADVSSTDQAVATWQAKSSDSTINDARVAGEGWKARQSVGR